MNQWKSPLSFPLWIQQQYNITILINQCTVCTKRLFKVTEDGWKWAPFHRSISLSLFCSILYLITITEADLSAELPAVFSCPTDKPMTLCWTVGSSTTVTASSTTVTCTTCATPRSLCTLLPLVNSAFLLLLLLKRFGSWWQCGVSAKSTKGKCFVWKNEQMTWDITRQRAGLFTANTGCYLQGTTDIKPPIQMVITVHDISALYAEFDLYAHKSCFDASKCCRRKFFSFQRLAWNMHFNSAARNEMKIS